MNKLTISNWSTFENAEVDTSTFNITIGAQSTGKSLLMKLIYYFNTTTNLMFKTLEGGESFDVFKAKNRQRFAHYFPPRAWGNHRFVITFESEIGIFRLTSHARSKEDIVIYYPKGFEDNYERVRSQLKNENANESDMNRTFYSVDFARKLSQDAKDYKFWNSLNIYIPASRAFFSNIQTNAFRFLAEEERLDPFIIEFGVRYEQIINMHARRGRPFLNSNDANELLGGTLLKKNDSILLNTSGERLIPISSISSGQQELVPLLLILDNYSSNYATKPLNNLLRRRGFNLYIEEPEAHLFPESQKKITELIALSFKRIKKRYQNATFYITTHSPYILTSVNNLLIANDLVKKNPDHLFADKSLDRNNTSAYQLVDGTAKSILDAESGLIDANYIDRVSSQIEQEFEELLDAQM